ncbi:choice-of-anchor D domain-containing protein [Pendulispora brunnea]|uniref:Choice-of-anchor D domain-containing protein n=1 Tax=Pendulispora brunnea TaxID=2905690 RepID=A0ABZ2K9L0_9BACT
MLFAWWTALTLVICGCSTSPSTDNQVEERTGEVAQPFSTTYQVRWSGNLTVPVGQNCPTTCGTPAGTSTCICGGQSNACIGGPGWGDKNFTDTSPANAVVTMVHLDIQQMGCSAGTVSAFLNGTRLGAYQPTATCACNACDPPQTVTSARFPRGIPGYNYGGVNTLRLEASSGSPCLARVDIRVDGTTARLVATPATYTFAAQRVDTPSAPQNFTIQNQGSEELTVTGFDTSGPFDVSGGPRTPFPLAPGQTATVGVTFTPTGSGPATGSLSVASSDPRSPAVVQLAGSGVAPSISVSPNPRDFGSVDIGGNATGTLTISNTGNDVLNISGIAMRGASDFTLVSPPTSPRIPAGQTLPLTVRFSPTAHGSRSAQIVITSDAANNDSYVASLTGRGQGPSMEIVTESPVDFGDTNVGTNAAPQRITVRNAGETNLRIASMTFSNADFSTTQTFPVEIVPNGRADIPLGFRPSAIGARNGNAVLTSNDPLEPTARVELTGTGTSPTLKVTPASLPFGDVRTGSTPSQKTVTLENTGTGPLIVSRAAISGPDAARFALSAVNLPLTIGAGDSVDLTVSYAPTAVGANAANLTIDSNDPSSASIVVPLTGNGVSAMISLQPASLDFGAQLVGRASAARTADITNTGSASLNISAVTVGGPQAAAFALVSAPELPAVVEPGAKLTLSLKFTPADMGDSVGEVDIASDDPNTPKAIIALKGTAVSQLLSVSPTSLDFGVTKVGVKPAAKAVTITNTGGDPIALGSAVVEGAQAAAFQVTQPTGSVQPGQSATVNVTYLANAAAEANATLKIGSADSSVPKAQVTLKARAVSKLLIADTAALDFGQVTVGQKSDPKVVTVTSQAGVPLDIASIASDSDQFVVNGGGAQLPPGGTGTFEVVFQPTVAGDAVGTVKVLLKDATTEEIAIGLTGHAQFEGGGTEPPPSNNVTNADIYGGGCGCRSSGTPGTPGKAFGGLALLAGLLIRRRHRRATRANPPR